ncbi:MAG: glutamine amidotransferase-related protein [Thermoproteota archaeon]
MDIAVIFTPGGQLNYNIWTVVRELLNGDDSRVKAVRDYTDFHAVDDAKAVIIGGGPYSVYRKSMNKIMEGFLEKVLEQCESEKHLLGICLGHQLIAKHFDGRIKKGFSGEYSYTNLELDTRSALFESEPILRTWSNPLSYGHAKNHRKSVKNRVVENRLLFPPSPVINPDEFINRALRFLKKILGESRVLLAASGGIDSMIVGELLHRALRDDVWFVHIDTGFMRPENQKRWHHS